MMGSVPETIIDAATAAPSVKLPSGVMSAKRSTRDDRYTPHASAAKASPCVIATSQYSKGLLPRLVGCAGVVTVETPDCVAFEPTAPAPYTVSARLTIAGGIVTPYW